ncbi:MAG: GIY-YIG nuclease family protein [Gallionellaceae bacterium]|nr:GIY-YIG nuclease family protein [Gallionellaceae bacterium]
MSNFFPPLNPPRIYAYSDSRYVGCLKVGYTTKSVQARVAEQYPVNLPSQSHTIELDEVALREDGSFFTDHDVHRVLTRKQIQRENGEWFACDLAAVKAALLEVKTGKPQDDKRTFNFAMRPEQQAGVEKAMEYFTSFRAENPDKTPHFLWNAKMRFGKTFATYQLAKKMGWKKVLILTFKPAVQNAWEEDLANHVDFVGWQFIARDGVQAAQIDNTKPLVCFGSFQDYLGKNSAGGIKAQNEWVHATNWDCVVFDEYHYGAWRDSAKELFEAEDKRELIAAEGEAMAYFEEGNMPITTRAYLYLSGTPFRAISSGEFIEEQIYNWTYSDEQKAKAAWTAANNPYAALPRMVMLTYKLPDAIRDVAIKGEFNEFDLNLFFAANGEGLLAKFTYENEVQKWLDLIRGAFAETTIDNLKLGAEKPPMPFSDVRLLNVLSHTFWFLPTVAACHAMNNLIQQKQNRFYQDYKVVVAAGSDAGIGTEALPPVKKAMGNPLQTKTITLSCGKLTTGVSVAPWTGIFMLRNASSPETYFQAAFRVQTPWVLRGHDANDPNNELIVKNECYVFDFAPDRALRQIADYSCRLNVDENNPEAKVAEFIHFLPVLAYDGSSMKEIDAAGILDMAMSGTTATLLARRWESALLVNVDNGTLEKLMRSEEAMQAMMRIEGFRTLNKDIETIINKSDSVKKAKAEASERDLTPTEKKQLTEEEKEYKSMRKQIQEKLIKFATRIPVFMYLTDYRERSLKDVILQLEPALFKKVTGLTQKDFELLVSLGVFNSGLMNDAVYKFKRYEDASLEYTGISRHSDDAVGLYDTVLSAADYRVNL